MSVELQKLGQAVKRLQHRHHRTLDARLAPLGTTLVQWDALRAVSQHPDASSHLLAQITFQTDQSFGALAARLAAQGLIERVAGTGRALRHRLTPAGDALLHKGHVVVNEAFSESFAPLTASERDTFYALLMRLLRTSDEPLAE
ncbi:MAG: MarR family transcriptional regulator [Anaerolineae bacterium]|nr:MarR family transcriptional regulator [Anaerolineae bacterium]